MNCLRCVNLIIADNLSISTVTTIILIFIFIPIPLIWPLEALVEFLVCANPLKE